MASFLLHAKISYHHFSYLPRSHGIISHSFILPCNHASSTCFHEHSTTYMRMRNKDIHVMQSHMLFTHSNNDNNHDNIHINKKFKPTHREKPTTTYSRA
ncbi:hypothetical protein GQ457_07G003290 [Hibiscus cannabinus]